MAKEGQSKMLEEGEEGAERAEGGVVMEMEWEEGLEERNVLVLRGEEEAGKHGRREEQATAPTYRARD